MRLCDGCNHWQADHGTPATYVRALPDSKEEAFCSSCYRKYVGYDPVWTDPLPVTVLLQNSVPISKDFQTQVQVAAIIIQRDADELELLEWRRKHVG